jgi:phosphodiesterase/alkaline phosphatase D-like protein
MVMDDHEIADNWSRDELQMGREEKILSANAFKSFSAFQRAHGPCSTVASGYDSQFNLGSNAFISLNTRVHRVRALGSGQKRQILSPEQWQLLEHWFLSQQKLGNHPKFVVTGSVFAPGLRQYDQNPSARETDNWQLVQDDRRRMLNFIAQNNIHNVIFLSGDYHCSASATITFNRSKVKAFCLVAPPLYSPLRFANISSSDVLKNETIPCADDQALICANAWNGEGWLEIELSRDEDSGITIHNHFQIQRMDANEFDHVSVSWNLT